MVTVVADASTFHCPSMLSLLQLKLNFFGFIVLEIESFVDNVASEWWGDLDIYCYSLYEIREGAKTMQSRKTTKIMTSNY